MLRGTGIGRLRLVVAIGAMVVAALVAPGGAIAAGAEPAAPSDCGCDKRGPYVAPKKGVAPAVEQTAVVGEGTSVEATYTVAYRPAGSQTAFELRRTASPGATLVSQTFTGDLGGGFSPDEDRFALVQVAQQRVTFRLYDLAGPGSGDPSRLVWSFDAPGGEARMTFSDDGRYLVVVAIANGTQLAMRVVDARTGVPAGARVRHAQDALRYTTPPPTGPPDDEGKWKGYGVARFGFSPDEANRSFVYAVITGQDTYTFTAVNLERATARTSSDNDPAAFWRFSPCGDALLKVSNPTTTTTRAVLFQTADPSAAPLRTVEDTGVGYARAEATAASHVYRLTVGTDERMTVLAPNTAARACLASLTVAPSPIASGQTATGTIGLASPAPADGLEVRVAATPAGVADVPETVTVPFGATTATFLVRVAPGTDGRTVTITATALGGSKAVTLSVKPNQKPIAGFGVIGTPYAGAPVDLDDRSTDADGEIITWAWDFGDGTTSDEAAPSHAWAAAGRYRVSLTVTDDGGATASASADVTVLPNEAPTAIIELSGEEERAGTATATDASTDPDDGVARREWSLDGRVIGTGPTVPVRLICPALLRLQVWDFAGQTATAERAVGGAAASIPGTAEPVPDRDFSANAAVADVWDRHRPVARTSVQLNHRCNGGTYAEHEGQSAITGPAAHGSSGLAEVLLPTSAAGEERWRSEAGTDTTPGDYIGQDAFAGFFGSGQAYRVVGPASITPVRVEVSVTAAVRALVDQPAGSPGAGAFSRLRWELTRAGDSRCDGSVPDCSDQLLSVDTGVAAYAGRNWYGDYATADADLSVYDDVRDVAVVRDQRFEGEQAELALSGSAVVELALRPGTFVASRGLYDATAWANDACPVEACSANTSNDVRLSFRVIEEGYEVVPVAGLADDGQDPVDSLAPIVEGVPARPAALGGWYNAPVDIDWRAEDPAPTGSGIASDPADTTAGTEGRAVTYESDPSCDGAGNCAVGTIAISLDATRPTVTVDRPGEAAFDALGGLGVVAPAPVAVLSGSAGDATSGVADVLITLTPTQGGPMVLVRKATCQRCGTATATWQLDTAGIPPGSYRAVAHSADLAGLFSPSSDPVLITVR